MLEHKSINFFFLLDCVLYGDGRFYFIPEFKTNFSLTELINGYVTASSVRQLFLELLK